MNSSRGRRGRLRFRLVGGLLVALAAGTVVACDGDDDATAPPSTTTSGGATTSAPPTSTTGGTDEDAPPPKVTGVTGSGGGGSGETLVTWDASPDPDVVAYRVYRAASPTGSFVFLIEVAVTRLDDVPGERAYYRVTAVDGAGRESLASETVCATPVLGDPC